LHAIVVVVTNDVMRYPNRLVTRQPNP